MEALALQYLPRFTSSSSRRVEELLSQSGLPAQASIAGCLGSESHPAEWWASLERIGYERSRVMDLPICIPSVLEEKLFEELAAALSQGAWYMEVEQPNYLRGCAFLTRCSPNLGTVSHCSQVYLVRLEPTNLSDGNADRPEDGVAKVGEVIVPDTHRAYAVRQMAQAWEAIARPLPEEDAAQSVDPDDYPLF
jgi:hypothetical protein